MEQKIFLEKNRSKYSVNTNNYLNLDLSGKSRLIPFNDVSETLSLNQLYLDERDSSNKYRMIFTVNPICSNVLFNMKTEVVRKEGSNDCEVLFDDDTRHDKGNAINTKDLDLKQAIRDTEYSHPDIMNGEPYVYHCGADIFNNHMLRNNDFVYISKENGASSVFNTIEDLVRNMNGTSIEEDVTPGFAQQTKKPIHIYQYDTILSMYNAYVNRLKEKDGWYGFNNSTNVAIPNVHINDKEISINKIMNNNKACEFIDMYPDRSLYSFIPKINKYKRRTEKNWDYCITYPYAKDIEKLNEICGTNEAEGNCVIRIVEAKRTYSSSGNNMVRMKSLFHHNFKEGDYIKLYYKDGDDLTVINKRIRVISLGDYEGNGKNRYFTISFNDISSKFDIDDTSDSIIDSDKNIVQFYYKKDDNGVECQYYFRKFKAITKENDEWLDSEVNKLAYGENIYGDRIAQVVFTDDIDIEGLVDHRGRPLTEVFFTTVKRNAGHTEWYENNVFTGDSIEFSHCFGKVTTGIDLPEEETKYNVRKIHNVKVDSVKDNALIFNPDLIEGFNAQIEDDITIETYKEGVIGDIVEYDPYTDTEVIMDVVQHRFNTAQRETLNDKYKNIWYDDLVSDDYDYVYKELDSDKTGDGDWRGFEVSSYTMNKSVKVENDEMATIDNYGNINPEGYFYNPYYRIVIRELSETVDKVRGTVISFNYNNVSSGIIDLSDNETANTVTFETIIPSKLLKNDILAIYNNETKEVKWGVIYNVDNNIITLLVNEVINLDETYTIVATSEGVPAYATYLPTSHSFVWKPTLMMSELENDSVLFNMPFSNGRHYIEQNVIIYLKRQDPEGKFNLYTFDKNAEYKNRLNSYRIPGWDEIDLSVDSYNKGNIGEICY